MCGTQGSARRHPTYALCRGLCPIYAGLCFGLGCQLLCSPFSPLLFPAHWTCAQWKVCCLTPGEVMLFHTASKVQDDKTPGEGLPAIAYISEPARLTAACPELPPASRPSAVSRHLCCRVLGITSGDGCFSSPLFPKILGKV